MGQKQSSEIPSRFVQKLQELNSHLFSPKPPPPKPPLLDEYEKHSIHILASRTKSQKQDLLDFEDALMTRIAVFLHVRDVARLMLCNRRLKSLTNAQRSAYASNYISQNLCFNMDRASLLRTMECIYEDTLHDWVQMIKFGNIIRKRWIELQNSEVEYKIRKSVSSPRIPLPMLSSEQNESANTNFQIRAQSTQTNVINTSLVSGMYKQVYFYLQGVEVEEIEQAYHSGESFPSMMSMTLQCMVQLIHACRFYATLLHDGCGVEDPFDYLTLYANVWNQFSTTTLELENLLTQPMAYLKKNITDVVLSIWHQVVMTYEIKAQLIQSFVQALTTKRRQLLQQLTGQQGMEALHSCIKALIDISASSNNSGLIGHPDFKPCFPLQEILNETLYLTSKHQDFYLKKNNFEQLTQMVQQDLQLLSSVFGDWITQNYFEAQHLAILKQGLLQELSILMETMNTNTNTGAEDNLTKSFYIDPKQPMMLESMIKMDFSLELSHSMASTNDSSLLGSDQFMGEHKQGGEKARFIRAKYPHVAEIENYIMSRECRLISTLRDRQIYIDNRRLYEKAIKSSKDFITLDESFNSEVNVANVFMEFAKMSILNQ